MIFAGCVLVSVFSLRNPRALVSGVNHGCEPKPRQASPGASLWPLLRSSDRISDQKSTDALELLPASVNLPVVHNVLAFEHVVVEQEIGSQASDLAISIRASRNHKLRIVRSEA